MSLTIFSLGAVLYEIVTGKRPTSAKTMDDLLQKRADGVVDKMPLFTPKELESIILKAMAREKNERYNTAEELAEDVQRYLDGELVKAHHYSVFDKIGRVVKRNAGKIILSGAGALMLTGAIAAISYFQGQASKAEAEKIKANEKTVLAEKDKAKAEAAKKTAEAEAANATAAKKTAEAKTLEAKAEAADLRAKNAEIAAEAEKKELQIRLDADAKRDKAIKLIQEGFIYQSHGKYEQAIKIFTEAIKVDDKFAESYFNRSLARTANKDPGALEDAILATELDPNNDFYAITCAHALEEAGQIKKAEEIFERIANKPDLNPVTQYNYASFNLRRKKFDKAIIPLQKYIDLFPEGKAYVRLACAYNGTGKYTDAKKTALLAIEKGSLDAYYELGVAQYSTGEYAEAEKTLKLAKQHRSDRNNEIGFMLNELEKLKKK